MLNDIYLLCMSLLSLILYLTIMIFIFFAITIPFFMTEPLYVIIERWVKKDIFSISYINSLWLLHGDISVIPRIILVMFCFVIENLLLLITVMLSGYWMSMILFKKVDK